MDVQQLLLALWVMLLILKPSAEQQQATLTTTSWSKTKLGELGVRFLGHKNEFSNSPVSACAIHCLGNPPCRSFSVHTPTLQCYIFSDRVSFGIDMEEGLDYEHYWQLSDHCPTPYIYVAWANVCYKSVSTRLEWMDAFLACQGEGAQLFVASTETKMQVLSSFLIANDFNSTEFKLGGNDLFREGWFFWLDGSPVTTWYHTQPDDSIGGQDCLENTRGHPAFNSDGVCDSPDRYICQWPMD